MPKASNAAATESECTVPETNLLAAALELLVADTAMWGPGGILPARLEPGAPGTRLLLATGPNACGKSFACRAVGGHVASTRIARGGPKDAEFFHVGMRMRTEGSGVIGPRTFVYGNESNQSTGATSLRAVKGCIQTSRGRNGPHVIALDEPDIGLSDDYALALGDRIAAFAADLPDKCDALVVVTHSRAVAGSLMRLEPHCLRFGPLTTREWLSSAPQAVTDEELDLLGNRNRETHAAVGKLLAERRAPGSY